MSNEAKTSKSVDPNYWYQEAKKHFIIQGKSERTGDTYAREMRIMCKYFKKPLNQLTEDEIKDYIYYRKMDCGLVDTSMRILFCGLKFLLRDVLDMDYPVFEIMRAKSVRRLPDVLTRNEVKTVLNHISTFHSYVFFRTLYSCGLRLSEGLNLQVQDIDGKRGFLKIKGKGSKERYVPLPQATYELLKLYWRTHKNKRMIFPALGNKFDKASTSTKPMAMSTVQRTLKDAARSAKVKPEKVRAHVLRHSYATHLLEAGVSIRAIQKYLGHSTLEQTMVYLHLTEMKQTESVAAINSMMGQVPLLIPFDADDIAQPICKQAAIRCRRLGRPLKTRKKVTQEQVKGGE
jgi:integrase/recombinase XerD